MRSSGGLSRSAAARMDLVTGADDTLWDSPSGLPGPPEVDPGGLRPPRKPGCMSHKHTPAYMKFREPLQAGFRPALLLLIVGSLAQAQPRLATFSSTADGTSQEYTVYTPRNYDPARKYPLILALHEEDSNHIAELKHVFAVPQRFGESSLSNLMTLPTLPDVDFIVACPFARGNMGYQGVAEQDVYDTLADVQRRYKIDEDRIYLTGSSTGGGAALWMGLTRPDLWAAVAPVCAAPIPGSEELAGNALNIPVRLFHGDQDPLVPVAGSRQWQKRFLDLGVNVEYIEYPGVRHNAWDFAYRRPALFEWFAAQKRNPQPDHVRYSTRTYRYPGAYWIRLDALTPGLLASVDAVRSAAGVKVVTQNVDGFTIMGPARTVTIDGTSLRLRPNAPLSFQKTGGRWTQGLVPPAPKRPGAEGPIVDALRARHIWVYGTAGVVTDEELSRRRAVAEAGASWSTARARLNPGASIKADRDVTEEDIAGANLLLFGTRDTNRLIARFASRLPFELNPGAADYGMVLVAPSGAPGRYVVVSSGLPWWTNAGEADRGGYRFAPEQYRLLSTFGDYILFRGSVAKPLAEGRFDQDWKLPPAAAEALRATGVIR